MAAGWGGGRRGPGPRPGREADRGGERRARLADQHLPGSRPHLRPEQGRRVRRPRRRGRAGHRADDGRGRAAGPVLRVPHVHPLPVAAVWRRGGRRVRQPGRPAPRRRGDRLHRPDPVAGVQPGRRGDRYGDPRPPVRDRGTEAETMRIDLVAGPAEHGVRLDVALGAHAEVGSRAVAQRLIDAGAVTVDGRPRPKRHVLSEGERVVATVERPETPLPADTGAPHVIAYEDDDLIVVDKPAGVVVHPAAGHATGTLSQALAARGAAGGDPLRPGIVHRLDRDTSGLLVVAKSEQVHRELQELIRRRELEREYAALVEGRPARSGMIDAPVGRDRVSRKRISTRTDAPRAARTHFELEEELPRTSLLSVRLEA